MMLGLSQQKQSKSLIKHLKNKQGSTVWVCFTNIMPSYLYSVSVRVISPLPLFLCRIQTRVMFWSAMFSRLWFMLI